MSATTLLAQYGPQAIQALQATLKIFEKPEVVETLASVAGTATEVAGTTTTADGGISQALHLSRQALKGELAPSLEGLIGLLSGSDQENIRELHGILQEHGDTLSRDQISKIKSALHNLHERISASQETAQAAAEPASATETGPKATTQQTFTAEDLERARKEGRAEAQTQTQTATKPKEIPTDPMGKILFGVSNIFEGELNNGSSEIGQIARAIAWVKGEKLDASSIKGLLSNVTESPFGKKLQEYIGAQIKGEGNKFSFEGLKATEASLIKVAGTAVTLGSKLPVSWLDGFSKAGLFINYAAEVLHRVPIIGGLLRIPGVRVLITGAAQFAGRFSKDLKVVHEGVNELAAQYAKTPVNPAPVVEAASKVATTIADSVPPVLAT